MSRSLNLAAMARDRQQWRSAQMSHVTSLTYGCLVGQCRLMREDVPLPDYLRGSEALDELQPPDQGQLPASDMHTEPPTQG